MIGEDLRPQEWCTPRAWGKIKWILVSAAMMGLWGLAPAAAFAHPAIEKSEELYNEAKFDEALDALAEAEAAPELSVDELKQLLEVRARVYLAKGDFLEMETELIRLGLVSPNHTFDRRTPPDITRTFQQVRGRTRGSFRVEVETKAVAGNVTFEASLSQEAFGLVRKIEVYARKKGVAKWTVHDTTVVIPAKIGDSVEYYARAVGPGQVIVAVAGSKKEPLTFVVGSPEPQGGRNAFGEPSDSKRKVGAWPWIVAGVAVAAGVAVLTWLLVSDSGDGENTNPAVPSFEF